MNEPRVVKQIEFANVEEYRMESNNFYLHFLPDCLSGLIQRNSPYFKRFRMEHPEIERGVTDQTMNALRGEGRNPGNFTAEHYQSLWDAYKIMSDYVFETDPSASLEGVTVGEDVKSGRRSGRAVLII